MTAQKRFLLTIIIIVLILSGLIIGFFSAVEGVTRREINQASIVLLDSAQEQKNSLNRSFESQFKFLSNIRTTLPHLIATNEDIDSYLNEAADLTGAGFIFYLGQDGIVKYGRNYGENLFDRLYFKENMNNHNAMELLIGKSSGLAGLLFSVPVVENGQFIGSICSFFFENDVKNLVRNNSFSGNNFCCFFDNTEKVLLSGDDNDLFSSGKGTIHDFFLQDDVVILNGEVNDSIVTDIRAEKSTFIYFKYKDSRKLAVAIPFENNLNINNNWTLLSFIDYSAIWPEIQSNLYMFIVIILIISAFMIVALILFLFLQRDYYNQVKKDSIKLRQIKARYTAISENMNIGLAIVQVQKDGSYSTIFHNEALHKLLNMDIETFEKYCKNPVERVYREDIELVRKFFNSLKKDGDRANISFRLISGENKYISVLSRAYFSIENKNKFIYMSYSDNSMQRLELEQYEKEMQLSENIKEPSLWAWIKVNVSKNYIERSILKDEIDPVYNVPADYEKTADLIYSMLPFVEDRTRLTQNFSRSKLLECFEKGESIISDEFTYIDKRNGDVLLIKLVAKLFLNPITKDIMALMTYKDRTINKLNELALDQLSFVGYDFIGSVNASTHKLTVLSSSAFDGDENSIYKEGFENSVPFKFEDIAKEFSKDYSNSSIEYYLDNGQNILPSEITVEKIKENLDANSVFSFRVSIKFSDGRDSLHYSIKFCYLSQKKLNILMLRTNISEMIKSEQNRQEQLEKALCQAENANKAKSEFLSRMSHDIRTPMNAVINLVQLAKEEIENKELVLSDLSKLEDSGRFLLGLINDILDMSRIESGNFEFHPEIYSFVNFKEHLDAIIRPLCEEKNMKCSFETDAPSAAIMIDKTRFNQVVFNILSNSVKYTNPGGTVSLKIKNTIYDERIDFVIEMKDNGIGMSEDFQKKLFQPFEREDNSNAYIGTGLGLAITKAIVDKMGGKIEVNSVRGKGTTTTVSLSAPRVNEKDIEAAKSAAVVADKSILKGNRILLCEDNELNATIAARLLNKAEMEVEIASNGLIAYEKFKNSDEGHFDVVLMDIRMPIMNGYESTEKIRALDREDAKNVPILAMTADAFSEDVEKCIAVGMTGHVAKPIDVNNLYSRLCEVIRDFRENGGGIKNHFFWDD